jgi:hypothetical protein
LKRSILDCWIFIEYQGSVSGICVTMSPSLRAAAIAEWRESLLVIPNEVEESVGCSQKYREMSRSEPDWHFRST